MHKYLPFLLLTLSLASCTASKDIETAAGIHISSQSLIYALPQTALKITLQVTRTRIKKGIYAEFAGKDLHLQHVPMYDSQSWTISGITITPCNEADPSHYYTVTYKSYPDNLDKLFSISGKGIILDFSSQWKNQVQLSLPEKPADSFFDPQLLKPTQTELVDTFYKTVLTDSTFRRIPVIKRQILAKTPEDEAQETAALIMKIRKSRIKILRAKRTYPPDGEALKINLRELDHLEDMYLAMFIGIKNTVTRTYTYYITPTKDMDQTTLCYFSSGKGIDTQHTDDNLPVILQLQKNDSVPTPNSAPAKLLNTLFIRIPVMTDLSIRYDAQTIASLRVPVYQFGQIEPMPLK